MANLQLCDGLWNHDASWHSQYTGTMALRVYKRKKDQVRTGLYPRLGRAVAGRLRNLTNDLGLEVSGECSKQRLPGHQRRDQQPEGA